MENQLNPSDLPDSYRTGDVQPPKNYRGITSLLLLLVLFLGCLVSALGFLNIKLFQLLQDDEDSSFRFVSDMRLTQQQESDDFAEISGPGIRGYSLSGFDQDYFGLPKGIYITYAQADTGLLTGDVLLRINGVEVVDQDTLHYLIKLYDDAPLDLIVYRTQRYHTLTSRLTQTN